MLASQPERVWLHVQLSFSSMITPSLRQWFLGYLITFRTEALGTSSGRKLNNSFKPNLLRYTKAMAEKACHGFGPTTHVEIGRAPSELQSLTSKSYSVFCLKKNTY